jgi:ATP-binding cassette subfamily B multidrug efflux pump
MDNRTTIIISHRVSSVKHCDEIVVLDDGVIIERGSHEALMIKRASYFEIHEQQQLETMKTEL